MEKIAALALALSASVTLALGDSPDRTKLFGTWQLPDNGGKEPVAAWIFEAKGEDLRIVHSERGAKVAEFDCNTMGRDCSIKDSGKSAKVTMYFLGSKLVQIETIGSDVVKRRFGVNGDNLEIEVIPISPPGKAENQTLKRAEAPH